MSPCTRVYKTNSEIKMLLDIPFTLILLTWIVYSTPLWGTYSISLNSWASKVSQTPIYPKLLTIKIIWFLATVGLIMSIGHSKEIRKLTFRAGRLYVGRWNDRVRAKRCDAEGGCLWGDSTYLHSNFDFLRNYTELPSMWISNLFVLRKSQKVSFSGMKTGF